MGSSSLHHATYVHASLTQPIDPFVTKCPCSLNLNISVVGELMGLSRMASAFPDLLDKMSAAGLLGRRFKYSCASTHVEPTSAAHRVDYGPPLFQKMRIIIIPLRINITHQGGGWVTGHGSRVGSPS